MRVVAKRLRALYIQYGPKARIRTSGDCQNNMPSSEHERGLVPALRFVLLTDTTRPASSGFRSDHQGEIAER